MTLPFIKKTYLTIARWLPLLIISSSMLLAVRWVFLVPIFQSPDEDYHADYIFSLYSKKRLIRGSEAPIAAVSHPYVDYLLRATKGQAVKYTSFAQMPADYGTKEFFDRLNKGAPDEYTCAHVNTNPVIMAVYPFGYYGLLAVWLRLTGQINHTLTFLFFAARAFSVILLGCGLALSYLTMREMGLSRGKASLILATMSFFPLVPFVGSYIQPDDLSFAAMSACFFLALRWRNSQFKCRSQSALACSITGSQATQDSSPRRNLFKSIKDNWIIGALGLALAVLFLCKYQFFFCGGIAIIAMIIATAARLKLAIKTVASTLALLLIPTAIVAPLQLWISWNCNLPVIDSAHWHWFAVTTEFQQKLRYLLTPHYTVFSKHIWDALLDQYQSAYSVTGQTFRSFWGCFGQCINTPLEIYSAPVNDVIRNIVLCTSTMVILLTLASIAKVCISLVHIARKMRWRDAFSIACSDPVVNTYFLFVLFMFLFNIAVYPTFAGQGRHWFPLLLPMILAAACCAPRILPSRALRHLFFYTLTITWLSYSIVGSYYALSCVHKRYYVSGRQPVVDLQQLRPVPAKAAGRVENFDFIDNSSTFMRHINPLVMPLGDDMFVTGWAADELKHSPAKAVVLFVDRRKMYQTTYGLESPEAVKQLHNSKYRFCGFGAIIPTTDIGPGTHYLSMRVISQNGLLLYTDVNISFPIKQIANTGHAQ